MIIFAFGPPPQEEVMPMAQFLWDVLAGFLSAVLAGLVLGFINRH